MAGMTAPEMDREQALRARGRALKEEGEREDVKDKCSCCSTAVTVSTTILPAATMVAMTVTRTTSNMVSRIVWGRREGSAVGFGGCLGSDERGPVESGLYWKLRKLGTYLFTSITLQLSFISTVYSVYMIQPSLQDLSETRKTRSVR